MSSPEWWCVPAILALGRWSQEEQGFKVILDYIMSSRLTWATRDLVSKKVKVGLHKEN